jgi:hypothetical protein
MRPEKKLVPILIAILITNPLPAQNGISITIPSPNASSLGLYGELPVSYFTGIPEISIPLYEVKGTKIELPIKLSYHASGMGR